MTLTQIKPAGLSKPVDLADNEKIRLGTGNDLEIYHDGNHSRIVNSTGVLSLQGSQINIKNEGNSEFLGKFVADGAVELYHDNIKKFETTSAGGTLTGDFTVTGNIYGGNHITIQDSDGAGDMLKIGAGEDLRIYHYNNNSYIRQHTDLPLVIGGTSTGQSLYLQPKDGENSAIFKPNGAVELYYDNSKKFETTSNGISVGSVTIDSSFNNIGLPDNGQLRLGAGEDLRIWHNATHSLIKNSTGRLYILSDDIWIKDKDDGDLHAKFVHDGAVELYHDNSKKFETTSGGCTVTGTMSTSGVSISNGAGAVSVNGGSDIRFANGGWTGETSCKIQNSSEILYIQGGSHADYDIAFRKGNTNTDQWYIMTSGEFRPASNNTQNIGNSSHRIANIYTNDLHLSNEGSSNDVDGTWGDWTIQEGESDLFLKNNRSGKKYKFNLTEVK